MKNKNKFQYGDLVKVKWPPPDHINYGMVIKVGKYAVKVVLSNGKTTYPRPDDIEKITSDTNAL